MECGNRKEQATLQDIRSRILGGAESRWQVAGVGKHDKTVKLWDVATGKERVTLKGHTAW